MLKKRDQTSKHKMKGLYTAITTSLIIEIFYNKAKHCLNKTRIYISFKLLTQTQSML